MQWSYATVFASESTTVNDNESCVNVNGHDL